MPYALGVTSPNGHPLTTHSGHPIYEVVLTGGPSAGKSSSTARITETMNERGVHVLVPTEIATLFMNSGVPIAAMLAAGDRERFLLVEEQLLLMQRQVRERYIALARILDGPVIILYDRAEMDIAAYTGREEFERLMQAHGLGYREVRDSYDLVLHLVSPAVDAPQFYTTENNPARFETVEQAAVVDRVNLECWAGANLTVINNETDFAGKLDRVESAILRLIGQETPVFVERKFLLEGAPDYSNPALSTATDFDTITTYLHSDDETQRSVKVRLHDGQDTYIYTVKRPTPAGPSTRERVQERITKREYRRLLGQADPTRQPVRKHRRVFVDNHLVCKLDEFIGMDLFVLEIEVQSMEQDITLPSFVTVREEVSNDADYFAHAIAVRG